MTTPDASSPIAAGEAAARMKRSATLLRVAGGFGIYSVAVLAILLGIGRAPWDATSSVLLLLAALTGAIAFLSLQAAQNLVKAKRPSMAILVGLALFSLLSIVPLLALSFFWLALVMQMAKPPAANQALFWALCAGGVLFVLMQILILAAAGMLRRVPIGKSTS